MATITRSGLDRRSRRPRRGPHRRASSIRADRGVQDDSLAEPLGHPDRDQLRAADEARVLGAAARCRPARRTRPPSSRRRGRAGATCPRARCRRRCGSRGVRSMRAPRRPDVAAHPVGEGDAVPVGGAAARSRAPRAGPARPSRSNFRRGAFDLEEHHRVDPRDRAAVAADPPAVLDQVVALDVRRERGDAHAPPRAPSSACCVGPTHWPPTSTTLPPAELVVEDAAADAVARLEDDARAAECLQLERGRQPREAGADDRDIRAARAAAEHRDHRGEA